MTAATSVDHPFASITATDGERGDGLTGDHLAAVVESLRTHGAAVIDDAIDVEWCDRLLAPMTATLEEAATRPAALDVPGHVQHNPPLDGAHLHPAVFANPAATSVARALFGPRIHLSLYTGNTMLGHTDECQPLHWDEPQLWPGLTEAPPLASLTVNIPLVDVTVENGALELWPGTHRDPRSGERFWDGLLVPDEWVEPQRALAPPVRVPVRRGSILLRDGRVWHRGTTNATADPRPMVAIVYNPWWFRPYAIDFPPDAEPVLRQSGLGVTARYREDFDQLAWPPDWKLVPAPVD